jgi:hypothetical protein
MFLNENGLPDVMVFNNYTVYFRNYNEYTFDMVIIYPNGTTEVHKNVQTETNWSALIWDDHGRSASGQERAASPRRDYGDISNFGEWWADFRTGLDWVSEGLGVASCIAGFVPGAQALLAGCASYLVGKAVDMWSDVLLEGIDPAQSTVSGVVNAVNCAGIIEGDLLALTNVIDCIGFVGDLTDLLFNDDMDELPPFIFPEYLPEHPAATFTGLAADGSTTQTTLALTLTFDKDIPGFSAADISLFGGSTGAKKGSLNKRGTGRYELYLNEIEAGGRVIVRVRKPGLVIKDDLKTVTIFKEAAYVTFNSLTADGSPTGGTTTKLTLFFDKDIDGFSASNEDISLMGGYTGAKKGTLTRTSTGIYELTVSDITTTGKVYMRVRKDGYNIINDLKNVTVYYLGSTLPVEPPGGGLDGYWQQGTRWIVNFNGSAAVMTGLGSGHSAYEQDAINKGFIQVGSQHFRNLTKTGERTWKGQGRVILTYSSDPAVAVGVDWVDCTITVNADGKTFQAYFTHSSGSFTVTYTKTTGGTDPGTDPGGGTGGNPTAWTLVTDTTFGTGYIYSIAYGNGTFVAGAYGRMAYSTDGINWTAVTNSPFYNVAATSLNINAIAYGNGKFVAGATNGRMAYSSDGGITWTVTNSRLEREINAIAYGNGKFVAGSGDGKMAYSSDGVNWEAIPAGTGAGTSRFERDINAIAYGNGTFAAVGGSDKMAYSFDGVTWIAVEGSTFGTDGIFSIAYGNGKFVAGSNRGGIAYSTDGVNWTKTGDKILGTDEYGSGNTIYAIAYGNNKFVAVGSNSQMAASSDGITWTTINVSSTFGTSIRSIAYGNGRFVAGGSGGKLAYSAE